MKVFGIDISTWQKNYPYKKAADEGVKFAILRAGFGRTKDKQFETHYENAKKVGWGVGAYWYMYATNVEDAKAEAKAFLKVIKGKQFEYPVYLDLEDKSLRGLGKDKLNAMVEAFGKIIEDAGYYFGVYTNLDWYKNKISGAALNKKYDWWIACWSKSAPKGVNYGLWQFGGETNLIRSNKVAGVTTDQNYAFKDYPAIMKEYGLNGFKTTAKVEPEEQPKEEKPQPTKSIDELAQEVIDGKWGNGEERKTRLTEAGYDASAVQKRVNEILAPKKTDSKQYYTVKKGDTLYEISIKFGCTIKQLQEWNNIKNANKIYTGQKIRVK